MAGSNTYTECPTCREVYRKIKPPSSKPCTYGSLFAKLHSGSNVISGYCDFLDEDFAPENIHESFDWVEMWFKGLETEVTVSRMSSPIQSSSVVYSDFWSSTDKLDQTMTGSKTYINCPSCKDVYQNIKPPSVEGCMYGRYYIWLHSGSNVISGYCDFLNDDFTPENVDESFDVVEISYKGETLYTVSRITSSYYQTDLSG